MPRVGKRHFKYTPEGKAEAAAAAKATGGKVEYDYSGPEMKGTKPGRSPKKTPAEARTPSRTRRKPGY